MFEEDNFHEFAYLQYFVAKLSCFSQDASLWVWQRNLFVGVAMKKLQIEFCLSHENHKYFVLYGIL